MRVTQNRKVRPQVWEEDIQEELRGEWETLSPMDRNRSRNTAVFCLGKGSWAVREQRH